VNANLAMVTAVAEQLDAELREQCVFVGGAIVDLFVSDPGARSIRPTDDVDLVIDLASLARYWLLADKLKGLGFNEDTSEGAPVCRWLVGPTKVDVMPTDSEILGVQQSLVSTGHRNR